MTPALLNIPKTPIDWKIWAFHNQQDHIEIIEAIAAQTGVTLERYLLDPIDFDNLEQFLEWEQQSHLQMTQAVGLQSVDLQDVDLRDERQLIGWIHLDWQDHFSTRQRLGI